MQTKQLCHCLTTAHTFQLSVCGVCVCVRIQGQSQGVGSKLKPGHHTQSIEKPISGVNT